MNRRPSRLKLAWYIYILTLGLAGLAFWLLAIFDKRLDPEAIVIGLSVSALSVAGSWSELRLYHAVFRASAEARR